MHTTAGYLLYAALTHKYVFDVRPGDVYACVADCGWITGHSYIIYGPLANGATTLMFESTPMYPDASRYWDLVQTHKITQFYTAPTAIRALMRFGEEPVRKHDLSSLRVLGSVGEPINPEAWRWYFNVVGKGKLPIIDSWWQTVSGEGEGRGKTRPAVSRAYITPREALPSSHSRLPTPHPHRPAPQPTSRGAGDGRPDAVRLPGRRADEAGGGDECVRVDARPGATACEAPCVAPHRASSHSYHITLSSRLHHTLPPPRPPATRSAISNHCRALLWRGRQGGAPGRHHVRARGAGLPCD